MFSGFFFFRVKRVKKVKEVKLVKGSTPQGSLAVIVVRCYRGVTPLGSVDNGNGYNVFFCCGHDPSGVVPFCICFLW